MDSLYNIELRRLAKKRYSIKSMSRVLGRDGHVYGGKLYMGNIAIVEIGQDDSGGGELHTEIIDEAKYKTFVELVKKLPDNIVAEYNMVIPPNPDNVMEDILTAAIRSDDMKKECSKSTLFYLKSQPGKCWEYNTPCTTNAITQLKHKYKGDLEEIVNQRFRGRLQIISVKDVSDDALEKVLKAKPEDLPLLLGDEQAKYYAQELLATGV